MSERPDTRSAADDGNAPFPDLIEKIASRPQCISRTIQRSVAESDAGHSGERRNRLFQVANCIQRAAERRRRIRIQWIRLRLYWSPLTCVGPSREALCHDAAASGL